MKEVIKKRFSVNLKSATVLATFIAITACNQAKTELPAILQNHKSRAAFTKLEDKNNAFIDLFNGKDLTGWYTYTPKYGLDNDEEKAFNVTGGALHFAGESMGYICTDNSYKNYYMQVVFRWGEKKYPPRENSPRDSGVLYHFPSDVKDRLWPTSIECQIQENDCGDYFIVGNATVESDNPNQSNAGMHHIVRTENFEKPNPEWNTVEIICYDDKSEHYVNGHKVNDAYNLSVSEGKILLQLEGAEIFYKTVKLLPLK
ncbi:MAG: DUF1080 domain-containing protein [Tannerella sp.]|jgi:hypothetical protein|nr:DUF1080 domain-containing protein [Tannerella sp.]